MTGYFYHYCIYSGIFSTFAITKSINNGNNISGIPTMAC